MRVSTSWKLSADGAQWLGGQGRRVPVVTELRGSSVVCIPIEPGPDTRESVARLGSGMSLWVVDEAMRLAFEGFAYDPVCPRILGRAAGEAAARAALAEAGSAECSVVFADVDHFKEFNDSSSHAGGDAALRKIAAVFRAACPEHAPVWRVGDEFCALLPRCSLEEAENTARSVAAQVAQLRIGPRALSVTTAVARVSADDFPEVMGDVSSRMLRGKVQGRGKVYLQGQDRG